MVAGASYDACLQDRRHTLAIDAAAWARNSKSGCRSPGLLADLTVRQFWSIRAAQLYISGDPDAVRAGCSWRRGKIGSASCREGGGMGRGDGALEWTAE